MKKYFFGLLAIVFAISFSAFTKPSKSFNSAQFRFNVSTYSQSDVKSILNYAYDPSGFSCPSSSLDVPCKMTVDEKYYFINDENDPELNTSTTVLESGDAVLDIKADERVLNSGVFKLSTLTDATVVNKVQP